MTLCQHPTNERGYTMQHKITRWLERIPEDTHQIVFRAGDSRNEESIIERWITPFEDLDDITDTIVDTMESELVGRLIAYSTKSKQLRSMTVRGENQPSKQTTEIGMLVEGILRMSEEQRRFVATITDSFQTMHETIQDALHQEREHHEETAELQLALALEQLQNQSGMESTTDKALGMMAQVLQSKTSNIDIKKMILENPNLIDQFLQDDEIINLVTDKLTK